MKGIAEFISVSPDGSKYAVGVHRRVDVYSIETAGVEYTIELKVRWNLTSFPSCKQCFNLAKLKLYLSVHG